MTPSFDPRTPEEQRDDVDRIAREWIGTPYREHAEVKGCNGGTDCAKLLKCVFVEAGLTPPFDIGHYSPQFFLHQPEEIYLGMVKERSREITEGEARHGDVVLYKIGKCFAHGAIIVKPGWPNIVHAHYVARCVLEAKGTSVHLGLKIEDVKFFTKW